jgi:cytochrome c oxidase assembly factor CtaG
MSWWIIFVAPAHAHLPADGGVLAAWHWRWDVISVLIFFAILYVRGWARLRTSHGEATVWHLGLYFLALLAIAIALLSPLDALASYLLIAHMLQHQLLMMAAAPLILLANPVPTLLWGFSQSFGFSAGHLLARRSSLGRLRDFVGWMPVAWGIYVVNLWVWHYPPAYEAALRNTMIHDLEHILFFLTALVFWWPAIRPVSRPAPVRDGARILYLFLAATQDALLAGLIALSSRILYPHYETVSRLWDLTPQEDQIGGGIVMFGVGSTIYALAILFVVNALLGPGRRKRSAERALSHGAEKVEGRVRGKQRQGNPY